jgi:hemerythrin
VYNWIIDHILNHDKKYFEFYQEQARPIAVVSTKGRRGRPRKYR